MAQGPPKAQRFRYVPSLDGLRALAVLGVIAYHDGISIMPAGFLGVDAFFVLSGFLITSLLVSEWHSTDRIRLGAFWSRRARRLLPALFLMVIAVVAYARFIAPRGMYPGLRLDALATLFYVANWHFILAGQNYFVRTGPPSLLLHTWTLSIEEQFYIVWPLVVLLLVRRRRTLWPLFWVSVVGAVASAAEMAILYRPGHDPTRVYFGTDTHAESLLIGAALAVGMVLWRQRRVSDVETRTTSLVRTATGRTAALGLGIVGIGVSAWAWSQLSYNDPFVFRGGIVVAGLAVAGVIASAVLHPTGPVASVLSLSPLRFVGRISYGMYLWHWPLEFLIDSARTGLYGYELDGVRLMATLAISIASYYLLEQPIRQGTFFTSIRAWLATPALVGCVVLAVVLGTAVPASSVALPPPPKPALHGAPVKVMLVGDSVALTLGIGLSYDTRSYGIWLEDEGILGCGVAIGSSYRSHGVVYPVGWACNTHPAKGYVQWPAAWANWIDEFQPNVVVLLAGRWEVMERTYHGHWTNITHPAYAAYVKRMLEKSVQVATAKGARMIFMTAPCYSSGEQPDGLPWPEDSSTRLDAYNSLLRQVASEYPGKVSVQNFESMVCPGGHFEPDIDGVQVRRADGVHFTVRGGEVLAPKVLPMWVRVGHQQEAQQLAEGKRLVYPVSEPPTLPGPS